MVKSTSLGDRGSRSLSAFRIILGLFLLLTYKPTFSWIADVPQALFNPPKLSVAVLFNDFPGKGFFITLDYLLLLSLCCITAGVKARAATVTYVLLSLVGYNFHYSFGKIDHSIMLLALLSCMAFSGWGSHLSLLPDHKCRYRSTTKSLSLLSVLICFAMFTAGFEKALHWVDFDLRTNGFLSWSQAMIYMSQMHYLLSPLVSRFPPLLLELFDYAAVAFELSPLLFLLHSSRAWRCWLLLACLFHLANTLLLNLPFTAQSLVYLVFIDFTWFYKKFKPLLQQPYLRWAAAVLLLLAAGIKLILLYWQPSTDEAAINWNEVELYQGLFVWTASIVLVLKSLLTSSSQVSTEEVMPVPFVNKPSDN